MTVREIDWTLWQPQRVATLLFVLRDGEVLLIEKKRGLGAGKVNGPGGHVEEGEEPVEAAVRETEEEVGIVPLGVEPAGELRFQFTDGLSLLVHVFRAGGCRGEPRETDEATPFWAPVGEIPFEKMWADDRIWFPWMLRGEPFDGRFLFDGEHPPRLRNPANKDRASSLLAWRTLASFGPEPACGWNPSGLCGERGDGQGPWRFPHAWQGLYSSSTRR